MFLDPNSVSGGLLPALIFTDKRITRFKTIHDTRIAIHVARLLAVGYARPTLAGRPDRLEAEHLLIGAMHNLNAIILMQSPWPFARQRFQSVLHA